MHHSECKKKSDQNHRAKYKISQGQALVEFVVAATFLLVPTVIMLPYLAKIADAQHKVHEATRYATWEKTVWRDSGDRHNIKTNAEINNEITQRVFGVADTLLHSVEDKEDKFVNNVKLDHFLYVSNNKNGSLVPILKANEDGKFNSITSDRSEAPESAKTVLDAVNDIGLEGIDTQGEHIGRVSIQIAELPYAPLKQDLANYLDNQPFITSNQEAILADAWNAKGSDDIKESIYPVVPKAYLNGAVVNKVTTIAERIGMNEFNSYEPGGIDTDRVPCQRLVNAVDC